MDEHLRDAFDLLELAIDRLRKTKAQKHKTIIRVRRGLPEPAMLPAHKERCPECVRS